MQRICDRSVGDVLFEHIIDAFQASFRFLGLGACLAQLGVQFGDLLLAQQLGVIISTADGNDIVFLFVIEDGPSASEAC